MLAYNLSPSFNWDTTGMSDDEMRAFPEEIGKMGFVFNFMTYGGHQIDGVAAEEFATALRQDGMLALARLQRKMRLVESPYRTPQTLVGGPRSDAALAASSGRTATTKAMGAGSTQHQHLVQTEVPKKLLEDWLALWSEHYDLGEKLRVQPCGPAGRVPMSSSSGVYGADDGEKLADVVFDPIKDRHGRSILQVRDQNTYAEKLRQKRLMTVIHLWMVHRFKADAVYYVTPTEDNVYQADKMKAHGIFSDVHKDVGEILVADVNQDRIAELLGTGPCGAQAADHQGGLSCPGAPSASTCCCAPWSSRSTSPRSWPCRSRCTTSRSSTSSGVRALSWWPRSATWPPGTAVGDDVHRLVVLRPARRSGDSGSGCTSGSATIGHGEDPRYVAVVPSHRSGSIVGFVARKIYLPQAVILFVVSLPVQLAMSFRRRPLGIVGAAGHRGMAVGFGFEAVGDYLRPGSTEGSGQRRASRGPRCPVGVDAAPELLRRRLRVRGPVAARPSGTGGPATPRSTPLVMGFFLVRVSGKALLEKNMRRSRGPACDAYMAREPVASSAPAAAELTV